MGFVFLTTGITRHALHRLLAVLLLLSQWGWADYNTGRNAYQNRQYSAALAQFKAVPANDPQHSLAQFYLGLIYAKQDQYQPAVNAFQRVIELEQTHKLQSNGAHYDADLLQKAEKNLAVVTKAQIEARGDTVKAKSLAQSYGATTGNYLAHAMSQGGKVIRWDLAKMPLRVFIASGANVRGWTVDKNQAVYNAMAGWKAASGNQLRFQMVQNISDANIVVRWQERFSHDNIGVSPLQMVGNTILQSDVHLATSQPNGSGLLSMSELNWTALHEFGHALGIRGHSPQPDDVMFFAVNPSQQTGLTARDRNTIKLLYRQEADVTNNTQVSTLKTKQVYELLQKAHPYIEKQPDMALKYVEQAYRLDPNNQDVQQVRNGLYFNRGVTYLNNGVRYAKGNRLTDARSAFKTAEQIFAALSREASPPRGTQQNLAIARQNIQLLSN